MTPEVDFLERVAIFDRVVKSRDLADVAIPRVHVFFKSIEEFLVLREVFEISDLANLFALPGSFNARLNNGLNSQINVRDILILAALCKVHFQRGQALQDVVKPSSGPLANIRSLEALTLALGFVVLEEREDRKIDIS